MSISSIVIGQETNPIEITGIVKDNKGVTLKDVNVTEKGTTNTVITNGNGEFRIKIRSAAATIVFSGVGFQTKEAKAEEGKDLSIVLTEDVKELSDVVVVGFGTQKKVNLTGSVCSSKRNRVGQQTNGNCIASITR